MSLAFPFNASSLSKDFDAVARPASTISRIFRLLGVGLFLYVMLVTIRANAQQSVELTWDPATNSTDTNALVTQYRVWYGTHTGIYTNTLVIGADNNIEVDGLQGGVTYYFAIQAMDQQGDVSPLSNEAVYSEPVIQPVLIQMIPPDPGSTSFYIYGNVSPPGHWELDSSPDLQNWTEIGYDTSDSFGFIVDMTQSPRLFFRVVRK